MELAHQQYLANLASAERIRDHEFELKKLQTQREEQEARLQAARLQAERLLAASNSQKVLEAENNLRNDEVKSGTKIPDVPGVKLKEDLEEEFTAIVDEFLAGNEADWSGEDIKELMEWIKEWQQNLKLWVERKSFSRFDLPQWEMVKEIKGTLADMQKELSRKGIFSRRVYMELEPEWVAELQKAIG